MVTNQPQRALRMKASCTLNTSSACAPTFSALRQVDLRHSRDLLLPKPAIRERHSLHVNVVLIINRAVKSLKLSRSSRHLFIICNQFLAKCITSISTRSIDDRLFSVLDRLAKVLQIDIHPLNGIKGQQVG